MNDELTKELKEAGFLFEDGCSHCGYVFDVPPTLSQLIEACREDFWKLEHYPKQSKIVGFYWVAYGWGGEKCIGLTPEEAVASLWLALNEQA